MGYIHSGSHDELQLTKKESLTLGAQTSMLDIVIVNWNAGDQLQQAVASVAEHHDGLVESVVIVDNNSTDGSLTAVEATAAELPFRLQILRNHRNAGFGAACNQGAALCSSEFVLFLNPDTRIFADSIQKAVEFMLRPANNKIGITGIQLIDERGEIARSCARFPTLRTFAAQIVGVNRIPAFAHLSTHMSDWTHDTSRNVDHIIGAFYLIRRPVFQQLGGFDERFFVYLEDLDLSLRASQMGYSSFFLAEAQAFHSGGGTSRQVKAHRLFYSLRSRLLYGFKHFSRWKAWVLVLITLAIEPLTRTVFSVTAGRGNVVNTWRGYGMLYRDMPQVIKRARLP